MGRWGGVEVLLGWVLFGVVEEWIWTLEFHAALRCVVDGLFAHGSSLVEMPSVMSSKR